MPNIRNFILATLRAFGLVLMVPALASAGSPTVLTPWKPEISPTAGVYDHVIASFRLVGKVGGVTVDESAAAPVITGDAGPDTLPASLSRSMFVNAAFAQQTESPALRECVAGGFLKIPKFTSIKTKCTEPRAGRFSRIAKGEI